MQHVLGPAWSYRSIHSLGHSVLGVFDRVVTSLGSMISDLRVSRQATMQVPPIPQQRPNQLTKRKRNQKTRLQHKKWRYRSGKCRMVRRLDLAADAVAWGACGTHNKWLSISISLRCTHSCFYFFPCGRIWSNTPDYQ